MSGGAILGAGETSESQYARRILAHEGFENWEAAAELSQVKFKRAERKISERLLMKNCGSSSEKDWWETYLITLTRKVVIDGSTLP